MKSRCSLFVLLRQLNHLLKSEHSVRDTDRWFFIFCYYFRVFSAFCACFALFLVHFKCDIVFRKVRKPETKRKNKSHLNRYVWYIIWTSSACDFALLMQEFCNYSLNEDVCYCKSQCNCRLPQIVLFRICIFFGRVVLLVWKTKRMTS